jgi:response regulator RpfG family c-di-GMP phosphodiesterase
MYKGIAGTNRVLVVDDEEIIQIVLQNVLSEEYSLAVVASGEEALGLLNRETPDVVLVDKNLPGMSGIDLLRRIKEEHAETEVIVITGYASLESAIEAMRFGAYDYLLKPFEDIGLVVEKVRRAAQKREMAAERRHLMDQILASNQELMAAQDRLQRSYLQTLTVMITALEARDAYTRGHSDRVAAYTEAIGRELGLSPAVMTNLVDGARLHDLGKIGIREEVLNKTGKLTDEEYEHIKTHPGIGAEIVGKMEAYQHLVPMIRFHHERIDGKGYPDGLAQDRIPMEARIIAVADTFDAMTSQRPYRAPRPLSDALRIVREVAGTQLDPKMVGAFLATQARLATQRKNGSGG